MTGYDGEGTIPSAGFKESFRQYRERLYGSSSLVRFFWQGMLLTIFSCFPTVGGCMLRGWFYRLLLGGLGKKCFFEKNIRFFNPGRLLVGDRVFIGEGSFFDIGAGAETITVGADSHISRLVTIRTQKGCVAIGDRVNIGSGSFIYGCGDIRIGDNTLIANQVEIISGTHTFEDTTRPMRFQDRSPSRIVIGEDVWIGTHAVILGGVTIGKGAVIGAGAVVHRDIREYAVAVGVPARDVRSRLERKP
ncbi:MAG: DapH/DapD/GlmU-related protein [PVC group bacterium]